MPRGVACATKYDAHATDGYVKMRSFVAGDAWCTCTSECERARKLVRQSLPRICAKGKKAVGVHSHTGGGDAFSLIAGTSIIIYFIVRTHFFAFSLSLSPFSTVALHFRIQQQRQME